MGASKSKKASPPAEPEQDAKAAARAAAKAQALREMKDMQRGTAGADWRVVGATVSEQDFTSASTEVGNIQIGELAAVHDTDGNWKYARLQQKEDGGLTLRIDDKGSTRSFGQLEFCLIRRLQD